MAHKLVFIGSPSVGKSSLIRRICLNKFDYDLDSTIGAAYFKLYIDNNDKQIEFDVWDTAGQERFNSLIPMYIKNSKVVFIVFDVLLDRTYNELIDKWIPLIYKICHPLPIIYCCANKIDLLQKNKHNISLTEIENKLIDLKVLTTEKYKYFKTSAKECDGINEIIQELKIDFTDNEIKKPIIENINIEYNYDEKEYCC